MTQPPATPAHSADGSWWWNGYDAVPAYSPDRRWWFDGTGWVSVRRYRWRAAGQKFWWAAAVWAVLLSLPWAVALRAASVGRWSTMPPGYVPWLIAVAVAAPVGTLLMGAVAGRYRLWIAIPILAVAGTAVLACWYVASMVASAIQPGADDTTDIATGAGLVLLGAPALLAVLALLYAGAGIGRLIYRSSGLPMTGTTGPAVLARR